MSADRRRARAGFSMIELLVALTITTLLIIGAVTMYSQSRNTFRAAEAVARLQENARYAMSFIETDLRMANYWGLNSRPDYIQLGGVSASNACEAGWATNVLEFVQGYNGAKGLACIDAGSYQNGTDVIVIRRAAADREIGALTENALYIQTSRVQGTLFVAGNGCAANDEGCLPAGYLPPQSETHQLLVHAYHISPDSVGRDGVPSLRRVRLITGPDEEAEEIIAGIEDMQFQFGVDTDNNATAEYYVVPGTALPTGARVVSVRVWLRVRAEEPDFTFEDKRTYSYAGVTYTPGSSGDANRYRRLVVSKTIQLRNTRYDE
jgi:prepilin-type N-terminal cleavage/methylation domain-containing protein